MKTLARFGIIAAVLVTNASANAADPQRMFELCLRDSFSTVAGARVDGPRGTPSSGVRARQNAIRFQYVLQVPRSIGSAGRRKLLDTFYYCLEGNGFTKDEMFWKEGSLASFKVVRDDRVKGEVIYFEGLKTEWESMQQSSISITLWK